MLSEEEYRRLREDHEVAYFRADLALSDPEGYSLEEAAQMCGCSYAAARQRLSRARKRLRTELEVYHG